MKKPKKRKILALVPEGGIPPNDLGGLTEKQIAVFKMEYDVIGALERLGHEVTCVEGKGDLAPIRSRVEELQPHIVFNMLEEFHGYVAFDQNVAGYLELLKMPYTGCNPRGLVLARDKALTKKILTYHRIQVPDFAVFPRRRRVRRIKRLRFPLFVKSLTEESSTGISHASIVRDDDQLKERVQFVHEQVGSDAIAEEYIEGRELYIGILGNQRLAVFPPWELVFEKLPEGAPHIATSKVKFDLEYQKKYGIESGPARELPDGAAKRLAHLGKRIYRALGLSGYARIDLRMREDGQLFVLEANPNPDLSIDEDYACSAKAAGLKFQTLVQRILDLGLRYHRVWHAWG